MALARGPMPTTDIPGHPRGFKRPHTSCTDLQPELSGKTGTLQCPWRTQQGMKTLASQTLNVNCNPALLRPGVQVDDLRQGMSAAAATPGAIQLRAGGFVPAGSSLQQTVPKTVSDSHRSTTSALPQPLAPANATFIQQPPGQIAWYEPNPDNQPASHSEGNNSCLAGTGNTEASENPALGSVPVSISVSQAGQPCIASPTLRNLSLGHVLGREDLTRKNQTESQVNTVFTVTDTTALGPQQQLLGGLQTKVKYPQTEPTQLSIPQAHPHTLVQPSKKTHSRTQDRAQVISVSENAELSAQQLLKRSKTPSQSKFHSTQVGLENKTSKFANTDGSPWKIQTRSKCYL